VSDVSPDLLAKIEVEAGEAALNRIWSLDNWAARVDRVMSLRVLEQTADYQLFDLAFDAGRATPDDVRVERRRRPDCIDVRHLAPPPGILDLSGRWWRRADQDGVLFAHRRVLFGARRCDPHSARAMLETLRETLLRLVGDSACGRPA
jgi:hypothetical protein